MVVLYDSGSLENSLVERRATKRKRFRTFAHLIFQNQNRIAIRTYDIGLGGIAVIAPMNMSTGSRCQIFFRISAMLQSTVEVCVSGRVMHSILSSKEDGFVIGFEFIDLKESDRQIIEKYVAT